MKAADEHEEAGCFTVRLRGKAEVQVPRYCPHRAGRLDHGDHNDKRGTITCPLHRSTFDLTTGEQLSGPACGPLSLGRTSSPPLAPGDP